MTLSQIAAVLGLDEYDTIMAVPLEERPPAEPPPAVPFSPQVRRVI